MSAKAAVIIPIYNSEDTIERCLKSALSQTLKDIKVVAVDDGSSDRSGEICDKIASEDSRLTVIHKKNAGVAAARNDGIDAAGDAEYFCFFDSDDYADPQMVEKLYNRMKETDADMCTCSVYFNDEALKLKRTDDIFISNPKLGQFYAEYMEKGIVPYTVWDSMYKAELINRYNIRFCDYKKVFSEDDNPFQFQPATCRA